MTIEPEDTPKSVTDLRHLDPADPQWERAHQAWQLRVNLPAHALDPESKRLLIQTFRVKRSERQHFLESLPGVVRRGARIDLEQLKESLSAGGIPCVLDRRESHCTQSSTGISE
jgi:hypothetical protein